MASTSSKEMAQLVSALETLGVDLCSLFEAIDWSGNDQDTTRKILDTKSWDALHAKLVEFEALAYLVEARRLGLDREAAETLKPWLDHLIHEVVRQALAAETHLVQRQREQSEVPLFGRDLFEQEGHRIDRLVDEMTAAGSGLAHDREILEWVSRARDSLLDLIRRSPEIPDFSKHSAAEPASP